MQEHSFVHGASYADVRQLIINITKRLLSHPPVLFAAHHRSQGMSNAVRISQEGGGGGCFFFGAHGKAQSYRDGFLRVEVTVGSVVNHC